MIPDIEIHSALGELQTNNYIEMESALRELPTINYIEYSASNSLHSNTQCP